MATCAPTATATRPIAAKLSAGRRAGATAAIPVAPASAHRGRRHATKTTATAAAAACGDASECCGETCAAIDAASCPAGKQRRTENTVCHGGHPLFGACSTDRCCHVGCQAWAGAGNTCSGDLALNTDEGCDGEKISGCNAEKCCRHPLEIKCQTKQALGCSKCAKYAPCVSSIDPRCIRQEALDCAYCEPLGLIECAVCAPEWDNNCLFRDGYGDSACTTAIKHAIPVKFNECYLLPPLASEGHQIQSFDGTYKGKCTDATCSSCGATVPFSFANFSRDVAAGTCTAADKEGVLSLIHI